MKPKRLIYFILFALVAFTVSFAGFLSRSSAAATQPETTAENSYFSYRYFTTHADSIKNVELLTEQKGEKSGNEKNGSEENQGLINRLVERGLKSFQFTFPNIFDFL